MTKDKIILTEKDDSLIVVIKMTSIMPCIKSIQQYEPQFEPQDIANDGKYFKGSMFESIADYFKDHLYDLIANNGKEKTIVSREVAANEDKTDDKFDFEFIDYTELIK